jgi:hypothetical protein
MYDAIEEYIIEFYLCSLRNDFQEFAWDDMQDYFADAIQTKLDDHGQGTFEAFQDRMEYMYGNLENLIPEEFIITTDYVRFTASDAAQAIIKAQYSTMRDTFSGTYSDLQEYVETMKGVIHLPLGGRIRLFDNIIHAQHVTGDVFEDLDTEDLKNAAKEMFDCEQEDV